MAQGIGANVVAEGVETQQQFEFLRSKACRYIQGFYFSKPLPPQSSRAVCENLETLMRNKLLPILLALLLIISGYSASLVAAPSALNYQLQTLEFRGYQLSAKVPENYLLELLSAEFDQPRMLTFADNGDLLIGSRSGHIYRLNPPYDKPQISSAFGRLPTQRRVT